MHVTVRGEAAVLVDGANSIKVMPVRFPGDVQRRRVRRRRPDLGPGGTVHQDVIDPPAISLDEEINERAVIKAETQFHRHAFMRSHVNFLILHARIRGRDHRRGV